jgi:hypothetical protein|tara:strand:+ start:307 stop:477 length:171 start_codon:yes stop_codon:yes gene_type:complete
MKKGAWKLSDDVGYRGIVTIERELYPDIKEVFQQDKPTFQEKKLIHITELNFYIHK